MSTAAVVYLAVLGIIDVAGVASIMTQLGVMPTPMGDLCRIVSYRQNYLAAQRILSPIFSSATQLKRAVRNNERARLHSHTETADPVDTAVVVEDLNVDHVAIPALRATPGERILLDSTDPNRVSAVLKAVLLDGLNPLDSKTEHGPAVLVAGYEYGAAPAA